MLDRKNAPPFVQNTSFELIKPEQVSLSNGIQLYFIEGGEQDIIRIELVFPAGRWFESIPGVSYFASNLILKGTKSKTSQKISETFESNGVHIEGVPGFDYVSLSVYGLTRNIPNILDLLIEILTQPTFPETEIKQSKAIYLQNLKINLEKTSYLSSIYFRKNLFGNSHPYGWEPDEEDVNRIDQSELILFQQNIFNCNTCFVSGKIPGTLKSLVQKKINLLKSPIAQPDPSFSTQGATGKNFYNEKKGSIQTSLRLGKRVIQRTHPDYPRLLLVNHILGGYFGSRLMKNIREEKGLTYGIHSSIHSLRNESYFVIGTDVNKHNRDEALQEIKAELKKLRTELVPLEELEIARNHFIGSLQSEMSTPLAHADKIKNIALYNLGSDYYQVLIDKIVSAKPETLVRLTESYLHEETLLIVGIG